MKKSMNIFEKANVLATLTAAAEEKSMTLEEVINRATFELEMTQYLNSHGIEVKTEDNDFNAVEMDEDDGIPVIEGMYPTMVGDAIQEDVYEFFWDSFDLEYIPSIGWTKRQVRRSHTMKDKAKHGLKGVGTCGKRGSKWGGKRANWVSIGGRTLRENGGRTARRVLKEQMNEEFICSSETPIDEGVKKLQKAHAVFRGAFKVFAKSVMYNSAEWYIIDRLDEVKDVARDLWKWVLESVNDFYTTIDSSYPEEGLEWRNKVVDQFMDDLYLRLVRSRNVALGYIKFSIKENLRSQIRALEADIASIEADESENEKI